MGVANETVYIKGDKNVEVKKRDITLGDVLSMECSNPHILAKLKTLELLKVPDEGKHRYVVSVLKIIECIHKEYPNLEVQNIGEADVIITYELQEVPSKFVHVLKIVGIALIVFVGAAFSVMTFNNDVDVTKIFSQIYKFVMGTKKEGFTLLELMYCIGLIIGILTFFNHFGRKRFTVDPTPMEVEMRVYEDEIQTTLIDMYSRKEQELDVGKTDPSGSHRS